MCFEMRLFFIPAELRASMTCFAITSTESVPEVSRSAFQMGMGYAVFADPSGATTKAYRAMALPTVFVLDKSGRVRDVMVGYSSPGLARLETLVKKLIQES